ncbi:KdsC family phosphatase [Methylomagnum ishizawai]|uniref:KdsC family phosphatase n=1 Tax=Methylomagnum ishizawai TaxID=1760988 RepID=UPI001C32E5EE|nr:HAD family hydrolase [Methylomagnum ishizawai]BBL76031.1 3-deoxy-D-manno-octulosonate 8-phosphate phosphatase [Methylomagnum ishizawai]
MPETARQAALRRAANIRLAIFDVDGVLTDGRLFFDSEGREYKTFHARDGLGLKLLRRSGVETAVISGRSSPIVARRMASLDIAHVHQGCEDKLAVFGQLLAELKLEPEQVAHVGDDWIDLPLLRRVGLAVAVADAHPGLREHVHWTTQNPGGLGAAREVCDLIMEAQGTLRGILDRYS